MIAGLTILALAGVQVVYYFHDHVPALNHQLIQSEDWEDALFRMTELPAGTQVHFIMERPVRDSNINTFIRFWRLNLQVDVKAMGDVNDAYLQSLNPAVGQVFFVRDSNTGILSLLRTHFVLSPPTYSAYDVPVANQLALYHASPLQH